MRCETNLKKTLSKNFVSVILYLTTEISFIITVTKVVPNAHELRRLANRKILFQLKKLVKAMMGKGISLLLLEGSQKNSRRGEPFAAKKIKKGSNLK